MVWKTHQGHGGLQASSRAKSHDRLEGQKSALRVSEAAGSFYLRKLTGAVIVGKVRTLFIDFSTKMPIKKAAIKDVKQNAVRRVRNLRVQRTVREAVKSAREAIANKDAKAAELVSSAGKLLDRAAQKNVIKKNTASRTKSRLAAALKK